MQDLSTPAKDLGLPTRIGLALGGGAARGWAHVGVIRALQERGVPVHCVAGTSIGALVGAAFTRGKLDVLEEFAAALDWKRLVSFLDVTFPRSGLIEGRRLAEFVRTHLQDAAIEDLPLTFCAIATNLATGREVVLNSGSLTEAVRASISLPGIFTPLVRDGDHLVDGGLVNPVPVTAVRDMGADFTIAVDINSDAVGWTRRQTSAAAPSDPADDQRPTPLDAVLRGRWKVPDRLGRIKVSQLRRWLRKEPAPSIFEVLTASIHIIEAQIAAVRLETERPDILIRPMVGQIGSFDFHRSKEAIDAGYKEAARLLSEETEPVARLLRAAARAR